MKFCLKFSDTSFQYISFNFHFIYKIKKGEMIQFFKTIGNQHLIFDAIISSDKVFSVPKQKAGKFMIGNSDLTGNFQQIKSSLSNSENLVAGLLVKELESVKQNQTPNTFPTSNQGVQLQAITARTEITGKSSNDKEAFGFIKIQ